MARCDVQTLLDAQRRKEAGATEEAALSDPSMKTNKQLLDEDQKARAVLDQWRQWYCQSIAVIYQSDLGEGEQLSARLEILTTEPIADRVKVITTALKMIIESLTKCRKKVI